jgi:hypothetical protein
MFDDIASATVAYSSLISGGIIARDPFLQVYQQYAFGGSQVLARMLYQVEALVITQAWRTTAKEREQYWPPGTSRSDDIDARIAAISSARIADDSASTQAINFDVLDNGTNADAITSKNIIVFNPIWLSAQNGFQGQWNVMRTLTHEATHVLQYNRDGPDYNANQHQLDYVKRPWEKEADTAAVSVPQPPSSP